MLIILAGVIGGIVVIIAFAVVIVLCNKRANKKTEGMLDILICN